MLWTGWTVFPVELRDDSLKRMGEDRPPGLHLGDIIRRMREAIGEKLTDVEGDQPGVRIQEGFLFERAVEYTLGGMDMDAALDLAFKRYMVALRTVAKQVRVERDGIHMTPDAFNAAVGECESYKSTRKKLPATQAAFEENFWHWIVQEKAYCLALGVDTVRWIVLFHAGDYSRGPGSGPRLVQSVGTFTADELVENWNCVLLHAKALR